MRYIIEVVVAVVVAISRNFNKYIFTSRAYIYKPCYKQRKKVLEKLSVKGRAHWKLELWAVRRFTIRLHKNEILSRGVSV